MGLTIATNEAAFNTLKPKNGELVYVQDSKAFYYYINEEFVPAPKDANLELKLYNINAQIMEQLPEITKEQYFAEKTKIVKDFINNTCNSFYMLYGKEMSYFTLYHCNNINVDFTDMAQAIFACIENIGCLKSFELTEAKDAIEIWVTTPEETTTCLYFFPYDTGVVGVCL